LTNQTNETVSVRSIGSTGKRFNGCRAEYANDTVL
jgi:hypothetical protein